MIALDANKLTGYKQIDEVDSTSINIRRGGFDLEHIMLIVSSPENGKPLDAINEFYGEKEKIFDKATTFVVDGFIFDLSRQNPICWILAYRYKQ